MDNKKVMVVIIVIIIFIFIGVIIAPKKSKVINKNIGNVNNIVEKKTNPYITNDMDEQTRKFYEDNPDFYSGFEDFNFDIPTMNYIEMDN